MPPSASILFPTRRPPRLPRRGAALGGAAGGGSRRRDRGRRGRRGGSRRPSGWWRRTEGGTSRSGGSGASTSPATRRSKRPRRTCCASSTTTSRHGPAGWRRCSRARAATRSTRRSAGRSAPRLEGHQPARLRPRAAAGHEPRPRSPRTPTPSSCGARTSRSGGRRSRAIGPFDVALPAGRRRRGGVAARLKAAGGRIRYVAAAGVDHRRVGRDARLRALARANYHRGRHARHWDAHKGTAPPVAGELRTLAGCVWHTGRRRCGNGIVLTALTLGRLREALAPSPTTVSALEPDWASGDSGRLSRRSTAIGAGARRRGRTPPRCRRASGSRRAARRARARRVLVVGVARPEHAEHTARTAPRARTLPPRGRGHASSLPLPAPASGRTSMPRSGSGAPTGTTGCS